MSCQITVVRLTQIMIIDFGCGGARRGGEGGLQGANVLGVLQVRQHVLQIRAVWSCWEKERTQMQPELSAKLTNLGGS